MAIIILDAILIYTLGIRWYYSFPMMVYLMGSIMVLNYECKIIIDRQITEVRPSQLDKTLGRSFSNFLIYIRL